jgi:GntR family transcriptional regulator
MLPSVRALAAEQGANPLTVAKAYQQFQNDGLVEVQRGVGMYVVDGAAERLRRSERDTFLREEWPEIRARMDRLGVSASELLAEA